MGGLAGGRVRSRNRGIPKKRDPEKEIARPAVRDPALRVIAKHRKSSVNIWSKKCKFRLQKSRFLKIFEFV